MQNNSEISGALVAIVTPFTAQGGIDYDSFGRLIDFQIDNGINGIVVSGCTGESYALSLEEFEEIITYSVIRANGRVPIIAGSGANTTEEAIKKSKIAQKQGANVIMVISPFLNKPTDTGIYNYFSDVARAVELPIIIYNVPGRTGKNISADLTLRIARDHENIIGVKEASGDLDQIMQIIQNREDGFKVFSGDDSLALAVISLGGDGCISVVANQAISGELEIARHLHYKYLNLMNLNFIETNPIPVKASLAIMDMIGYNYRSPLCLMEDEANFEALKTELEELGLTRDSAVKI